MYAVETNDDPLVYNRIAFKKAQAEARAEARKKGAQNMWMIQSSAGSAEKAYNRAELHFEQMYANLYLFSQYVYHRMVQ